MSAPSLEAALAKVCADNNLSSIDVGYRPGDGLPSYCAHIHWAGDPESLPVALGWSQSSIFDALADGLSKAAAKRSPKPVCDGALPSFSQVPA